MSGVKLGEVEVRFGVENGNEGDLVSSYSKSGGRGKGRPKETQSLPNGYN